MSQHAKHFKEENGSLDNFKKRDPADEEIFTRLMSQNPSSSAVSMNSDRILLGTIVEITKEFVVVDVGLKSEGLIPIVEFSPKELQVGNQVEVHLDESDYVPGQVILSRDKAKKQRQWEYITENYEEGAIVKGVVARKVKGGLIVSIDGIDAFLPGSQIDRKTKNIDEYIGQTIDVKIIKINTQRKNIVVSHKDVMEEERISKKTELLEGLQRGDIRRGIVKNITEFGVFLDVDGVDGLLHITDMSWQRIKDPSELVQIKDEIDVMILNVDKEKGRLSLGLKQKEPLLWNEIEKKYSPGTKIKGRVANILPYGVFVELEAGVEGLIHISEVSWIKNIIDLNQLFNKGDEVEAVVLSVHKEEGKEGCKISLGMKQLEQNPWEHVEERYPIGSKVVVCIKNLTHYGAFAELALGLSGLIHISDMSWIKKISCPSEILQQGDKVQVVILNIDKENQKIYLGMKQLTENPWDSIEETFPINSLVKGLVAKITALGVFVELENGIEGIVPMEEISDLIASKKIEDLLPIGMEVQVKVTRVDRSHKRIFLSVKDFLKDGHPPKQDDIVVGAYQAEPDQKTREVPSKKKKKHHGS